MNTKVVRWYQRYIARYGAFFGSIMVCAFVGVVGTYTYTSTIEDPYYIMGQMFEAFTDTESFESTVAARVDLDVREARQVESAAYARQLAAYNARPTAPERGAVYGEGLYSYSYNIGSSFPPYEGPFSSLGKDYLYFDISMSSFGHDGAESTTDQEGTLRLDSSFFDMTMSYRKVDTSAYVLVSRFTAVEQALTAVSEAVAPYLGTWIAFKSSDVDPYTSINLQKIERNSAQDTTRIRRALLATRPFILEPVVGDDSVYTYKVIVNPDGLRSFLFEIQDLSGMSTYDIDDISIAAEEWQDSYGDDIDIRLIIDKTTMLPVSFSVVGSTVLTNYSDAPIPMGVHMSISFDRYNDRTSITAPATYKTIQSIIGSPEAPLASSREQARDGVRMNDLRQIQTALELYYTDNQMYPATNGSIVLGKGAAMCLNEFGFQYSNCTEAYMWKVPADPQFGQSYTYRRIDSTTYEIVASLEGPFGGLRAGTIIASPTSIRNTDFPIIPAPTVIKKTQDSDNDGLSDMAERIIGSDPYNSDTDGDRYPDGLEFEHGYNLFGPGRP